ncbi:fimbria/pilus periplasmic chaperone [Escherichia coli]|uniref:fimbria/pilus periplasmic chaperone n=1 Tax=Escherichia coli TaxID=562 RepID=UPI000246EA96|nr:fimbria/pilus periplasmic chaperone [Escherichia coli]EHN94252.1 hypothetical protein ESOG_04679 [Escherichia coli E101]
MINFMIRKYISFFLVATATATATATASVIYPYPEDTKITLKRDVHDASFRGSVRVSNPGERAWLVQSWVEDSEHKKAPLVFPSITRLEPKSSLRLAVYKGNYEQIDRVIVMFIPPENIHSESWMTIPIAYKLKVNESI